MNIRIQPDLDEKMNHTGEYKLIQDDVVIFKGSSRECKIARDKILTTTSNIKKDIQ